jgi:hypothetical protein
MTDDEMFIAEFESQRWPLDKWHHRDHIKLAYLYLCRYPLEDAGARLAWMIRAHNAAHQLPESLTSGYHDTMTQAWLRLIHFAMCEYGLAESADAFYEAHPELWGTKTLRLFYSRERFLTPEAKARFVEPDLAALPRSGRSFRSA